MPYEKRRFTDEQIDQANNVNLIAYAESMGLPLKKTGRAYKVKGHGGLYIDAYGHRWNWFSQNKGGGPIQFVMEMEGKSWVEAINTLLGIDPSELKVIPPPAIEEKEEFKLPEKNDTFKHIIAYLIQTRGIDRDVVYDFINQGKLYENKYKSCVFVGRDEQGEAKYASVRSTNTAGDSFRADVKGSDKRYPFCYEGTSKTVCIFESPIDLMSYLTLLKYHEVNNFSHHMISLGGVADKALDYYLKQYKDIDRIMLCLDNDKAGHFACHQFYEKYHEKYKIVRHSPKGKDFNEDLLEIKNQFKLAKVREPPEAYLDERDIEGENEIEL